MAMQERSCLGCGITGKKATIIHPLEDFQKVMVLDILWFGWYGLRS